MGWDYHHEIGPYDRRAICRRHIGNGYEVVKDAVVGTTYYAAIKSPEDGRVYALIILTHIDRNSYCNFGMKWMSDDDGPHESKCPTSVLKELSPTENKYALEWRERCSEYKDERKQLLDAPIGTRLRVTLRNGEERIVVKRAPAYQFKSWWLLIDGSYKYIKKSWVVRAEIV